VLDRRPQDRREPRLHAHIRPDLPALDLAEGLLADADELGQLLLIQGP
jgi:hypothetical protein